MARYKHIDTSPRFLALNLENQLIPGTFEHALCWLIDREIDLSGLDVRYKNDLTGAKAYPPSMLLKIVLFAYSRGIVGSRAIERACREHVTFIALSGDSTPHFTSIANFVSTLGDEVARIFSQVLYLCDREGLIGREMFAIDGVKLPSNAAKSKSGTRAEFERQAHKLETAAKVMLTRHREKDALPVEADLLQKEAPRRQRMQREAQRLRQWLKGNPQDRQGSKGSIRKSNRTDNESAKMATDKGVIQGYAGVAAVDDRNQIIVEAQAHGTGSEQALLIPVVRALSPFLKKDTLITADAGYHSEANLKELAGMRVSALIADNGMRGRDERFKDRDRHKQKPDPLYDKSAPAKKAKVYQSQDFTYDPKAQTCVCPAGKNLYIHGSNCKTNGYVLAKFQGAKRDCVPCDHRDNCLRTPEKTLTRQVAFIKGRTTGAKFRHTDKMREAIDSERGRALYGGRFATVEPVFANLRYNKGLDRFTLRGQKKVDGQWKLFCLVHNIEKLAHHGYGQ